MIRSDESLFDPRIADWLEDDPHAAPDLALDIVLAALPSIKQRRAGRVPRRFLEVFNMRTGLVAAATVIAISIGGLYMLGPRPTGPGASISSPTAPTVPSVRPTVAPSPTGAPFPFTSPRYRYAVTVPAGWAVTAATLPWPEGATLTAAYADAFKGPPDAGSDFDDVLVASQFVPDGMEPADWLLRHAQQQAASARDCKPEVDAWTDAEVAAEADGGLLRIRRVDLECQGIRLSDIAFVVENRGYAMSGNGVAIARFLNTFEHGEFFGTGSVIR